MPDDQAPSSADHQDAPSPPPWGTTEHDDEEQAGGSPRGARWKGAQRTAAAALIGAALFVGGGAAGWFSALATGHAVPSSASGVAPLLWQAWNLAESHYVQTNALNPTKMIYGAIGGMLGALGDTDHTRFLTPEEVKQENSQLSGQFVGIGVEINLKDGKPVVVAPLPNSPAQKAGLEAGDVILDIDGHDTTQQTLSELAAEIRGPAGSAVRLTILRPSAQRTFTVTVTRAAIPVPAVETNTFDVGGRKLVHLHVIQFSQNADKELRTALEQANTAHVDGIILDLRDNPGGLLDQAIDVSSQFLTSGNVVVEEGRNGVKHADPVKPGGLDPRVPLVVLINEGTASAAEITAGALKDHDRGPLVGTATFGTGTVLSTYNLSDGSEVLLGTEEWLTPNGTLIWHHGITPTQQVALPANVQPLFPSAEAGKTGDQLAHGDDTQLDKAISDLGG